MGLFMIYVTHWWHHHRDPFTRLSCDQLHVLSPARGPQTGNCGLFEYLRWLAWRGQVTNYKPPSVHHHASLRDHTNTSIKWDHTTLRMKCPGFVVRSSEAYIPYRIPCYGQMCKVQSRPSAEERRFVHSSDDCHIKDAGQPFI